MTAASSTDPAHTSWVGRRAELRVGAVAHGGHCVARLDGRVVFVRHALPGELVTVLVTEDGGGSFCRADAVEITEPSPDRVEPPCRYAHPGGCGGCDFQHVDPAAQRRLKADVVIEQFHRLAQLEVAVDVAPLTPEALGWRRRVRYTVARTGRLGLHEHRSGRLVEVEECLLGVPGIAEPPADAGWRPGDEVQASQDDRGRVAVLVSTPRAPARGRRRRQPGLQRVRSGPAELRYQVGQRWFRVRAAGFWQAHVQAAEVLNRRMLDDAAVAAGETVLDLYCGAGLFTAFLAESAGVTGRVVGIEAEPGAAADANATLAEVNWPKCAGRRCRPNCSSSWIPSWVEWT